MPTAKITDIQLKPGLRKGIFIGSLMAGGAFTLASMPFAPDWGIHLGDFTLRYSSMLDFIDLTYFALSWGKVETDHVGGATVAEIPTEEFGAGWKFIPFGIGKLLTVPIGTQEVQFPGDPEQISKKADRLGLQPGQFRPMRVMTGPGKAGEGDDPLNERTAVEMTFSVRWRVEVMNFFEFWLNTPGRTWPEKKAAMERQMRDTGENVLTEEISKMSAGDVTNNIERLNQRIMAEICKVTADWGITILECRIQSPDYGERISGALADKVVVNVEAINTRKRADAEKYRHITESEGKETALANLGRGRGKAIAEGATAAGIDVVSWRNGELAKKLLPDKTLIIGEDGIAKAVGIGKAVTEALK